MTADVNVTEKVARAEAKRREPLQWRESVEWRDGFVAGALWHSERLADPEVLAGMAGVLADHVLDEYASTCSCEKWEHFEGDSDERIATYTAHVATALADWLRGQG